MQIDANVIISKLQQELANATLRALVAESALEAVQAEASDHTHEES